MVTVEATHAALRRGAAGETEDGRSTLRYALAASAAFAIGLGLYVRTLLPDVGAWDTAEFQAIGPVLGIAHPTGYPTYTMLAWLASVLLQPFGNEAYRADLLSALLVAGAGALAAVAAVQLTGRAMLGLLAGIAFIVTPMAWRVGVRADAHALHAFLAALLLVLLFEWQRRERREAAAGPSSHRVRASAWLVAAAVVFGLSLGNHALTLLLAPGIALFVLLVAPALLWQRWRLTLACVAAVTVTTVAVYAYIPLRSLAEPPLDYARPRTWERFWYLVLGGQFQGAFRPLPGLGEIAVRAWEAISAALGPLPAALATLGVLVSGVRNGRVIVLTGLWFAGTWAFALGYPNAVIERYYLVPILVACIWLALSVDGLASAAAGLRRRFGQQGLPGAGVAVSGERASRVTAMGLGLVLLAIVVLPVPGRLVSQDASSQTGRPWLEATLGALERDAVVISWWSFSTTLWYGRWVEGRRDDILIVDDRDVLDDGYGTAGAVIERFIDERPVYIVRLEPERLVLAERYLVEPVPGIPYGNLYRVLGRRAEEVTGRSGYDARRAQRPRDRSPISVAR
ncbi:hypothetical protein BH23CHL8_BH23CHL8_20080 [soil metagenome]